MKKLKKFIAINLFAAVIIVATSCTSGGANRDYPSEIASDPGKFLVEVAQTLAWYKNGKFDYNRNNKNTYALEFDGRQKEINYLKNGISYPLTILSVSDEYYYINLYSEYHKQEFKCSVNQEKKFYIVEPRGDGSSYLMSMSFESKRINTTRLKEVISRFDFKNSDEYLLSEFTAVDGTHIDNDGQHFIGRLDIEDDGFFLNDEKMAVYLNKSGAERYLNLLNDNGDMLTIYADGKFYYIDSRKKDHIYAGKKSYLQTNYQKIKTLSNNVIQGNSDQLIEPDQSVSYSSGFVVSPSGFVLTCDHSVNGAGKIKIYLNNKTYNGSVVYTDKINDVALLKIETNSGILFKSCKIDFNYSGQLGEKIITYGFPNPELQGFDPKYSEGVISGVNGLHDNPRQIQISNPIQPGNSGGGLFNLQGKAIGVVTSKLNFKRTLTDGGYLPENVNFATKLSKIDKDLLNIIKSLSGQRPNASIEELKDTCV
ncbi:S1C family serine protease, partial [Verrucomicrobia bacterium]|nr:S1C family serine protease [Verrucomicrobiota bacterium]